MRDPLPQSIDPQHLIATGENLVGILSATRCQRVSTATQHLLGDVTVEISLVDDAPPNVRLVGRICAELELVCQRCLQPMCWTLDEPLELVLVAKGTVPCQAGEGSEILELDEHGKIDVANWVEDEIILRIPNVPKHKETQDCNADILQRAREYEPSDDLAEEATDNPFKILENWKGKN